jgi:hypothetical protein
MRHKLFFLAIFPLLLVPMAAQVAPAGQSGTGAGVTWWVGGAFSTFNPDYGCADSSPFSCGDRQLMGVATYLDSSPFLWGRVGLEGEVQLLLFHGPITLVENSYMGGPRFRIFRYRNLTFSAKVLAGEGHLDVPAPGLGGGNYFAYAPGGAFDSRVAPHIAVHVGYEYQIWPGYGPFKGGSGGRGGLTPNGFSFGVSYAFHSPRYGEASY